MYYVYILKLCNRSYYTGSTPDLKHRLNQHIQGEAKATRNLRPVKLVWYCVFPNRLLARRFERYLKSGSGQSFRNRHLI